MKLNKNVGLSPQENYLEAIRFGSPEYMPRGNEDIFHILNLGILRIEDWTDPWGVGWVLGMEGAVPFPKLNPIADITAWESFKLPDPDALFDNIDDKISAVKAAKNEGKLIVGEFIYFLFERVWALTGLENFLPAMIDEPEAVHGLLHRVAEYAKRVFDNFLELGVDAVSVSEDLGTQRALMLSPGHFDTFLAPEYRFIFENMIAAGKIIRFHCCGCVEEVIDRLTDIQISVLNPVQARANDLALIKRITFGKTALDGGIDSHLLLTGTPSDVQKETARVIDLLKPGGGYICAPDQGFPDYPPGNMDMLYKTAAELGKY